MLSTFPLASCEIPNSLPRIFVADDHFQRLLAALDLEAEATTAETLRISRRTSSDQAERSGLSLVDLAIRTETAGFGGRVVVTLGICCGKQP